MAETRSKNPFQTTNLPLATFLIMEGHEPTLVTRDGEEVRPGHPQGAWQFVDSPQLQQLVNEFSSGDAAVDPATFRDALNATRRNMFTHLGIGSRR
jgi:hypothetical protein